MVWKREVLEEVRQKINKRRRLIWLSALGVFCLIIALLVLFQCTGIIVRVSDNVQSAPQNGEWAMFRRDLLHTGNADTNSVLPEGKLKWTFTTGGPVHSSPAVSDGTVYFGSRDGNIYAVDISTGEKRWTFKTGSWVDSSPVIAGGVLYCGSNDGNLYALDAKTGEKRWAFQTPYAVRSSPAVADGVVYTGADDYHVYAVDAATGNELWRGDTDYMVISAPAISEGILTVGSIDGMFYSFNAKTGSARLQLETKSPIVTSPAIKDGIAYFADDAGYFYAVDIKAKNWFWENKIKIYWNALYAYGIAPKPPKASGFLWDIFMGWEIQSSSSPAVVDNNAYLGAGNSLMSIDITTRQIQWIFDTENLIVSSPAITATAIYVGGEDGHLYAIDRATGAKLWDSVTGDIITSSPAIADGMVFIGSHDGKLYAFK
jgi:outer membrane protein assembly factor BamB